MPPLIIDPVRIFEVKGQVCKLQSKDFTVGVANNQQAIAAVSGQIIRVMGYIAEGTGGAGALTAFRFQSGAAGTPFSAFSTVPDYTLARPDRMPIVDCGYYETLVSEGLYGDVVAAGIAMTIFYITYTP